MNADEKLGRVDFTYWPETETVEWHAHADSEGDTEMLVVPVAEVVAALAAFEAERRRRIEAAAWFDRRRVGCETHRKFQSRSRMRGR